ncbi:MAG: ABC transporter substrate-binding protein [Treponema sp.]|jgi:ABC-type Fe3+ transport system substrate-binding protein|nr:ABC transporter substrate-binding protein [Treponema sp.]
MKKEKAREVIPDSMREELDFIGHIYCPVKERFSQAYLAFESQYNRVHEPKLRGLVPLGSCGMDIYYHISTIQTWEKFPAVVTEAGYGDFFTDAFLTNREKRAWFAPWPSPQPVNPLFQGLELQDPLGIFSIYGAMPYVFLVNHKGLGKRPVPRRIADLTDPVYEGMIGSVYAPEDITELLLLEIWKEQGEAGIRSLAHSIGLAAGTRELAASALGKQGNSYGVYIMSWFFAHAVPKRDYLEILWPDDGALFSPLYALVKRERSACQSACGEFLFSRDLGTAMAGAWFTHLNPEVHYPLPQGARFRWVGWDYIYEKNISLRVSEIEQVYYAERDKILSDKPRILSVRSF